MAALALSIRTVNETARPQCQICHQPKAVSAGTTGDFIRPSLAGYIQKKNPDFDPHGFICHHDLGQFRSEYVKEVLEDELGELSALDQEVVESLRAHEILSENIGKQFDRELTFGERLSDKIASFGGSWTFIMIFGGVLVIWIIINTAILATRAFDPYPFILMNLILSCLAALQAPIIMMSQNRSAARDRAECGERLQGEPESRARDPAPARETRSPSAQAIQPALRDPANPDRTSGRAESEAIGRWRDATGAGST